MVTHQGLFLPYRLGQIGLVGNNKISPRTLEGSGMDPYRLGQIGLVGNFPANSTSQKKQSPTDWVKSD